MKPVYKYCPPERIDILENLSIRLTQPVCFNDPFEAYANVKGGFNSLSPNDARNAYGEFQGRKELIKKKGNHKIAKAERRHWALNQIRDVVLNQMGVVSLSSKCDDTLMWGHYAHNARGFVIGLLPVFELVYNGEIVIDQPERVIYKENPPIINLDPFFDDDKFYIEGAFRQNYQTIMCTKSNNWSYENEFRLIRSLPLEPTSINDNGYPVHLLSLSESQVLGIISGVNSSKKLDDQLRSIAKNYNAPFYKAFKDISSYSYGVWDEKEYNRKMNEFGDKRAINYKRY